MTKKIFLLLPVFCFQFSVSYAIGMEELADSLTALTGFSRAWCPPVKIKSLRVNGNNISLQTNNILSGVRWTKEEVNRYNLKVSQWVLGNNHGKVTIYTNWQPISELITDCARGVHTGKKEKDLSNRNIALWPSHGLYYNTGRDEWIWQRATLWTTVEDLYSQEYMRLLRPMLENAGATTFMPRPGLEHGETGPSGMPRWTEGARYWIESQGADSSLWNLYDGDHYKDDMKSRCMWVNSLTEPIDLCLALHTDGADSGNDSAIVGTLCIYTPFDDEGNRSLRDGRNRQKVNRNLADWIQTQVTSDLRHLAPEWTRRQLMEANYCESRVPVVPSVLVELVSHKNMADMRYGLDPKFRFAAARAIYKGILRYLNGPSAVVQPLPVNKMRIDTDFVLHWTPAIDSIEPSAKPSYYMVYIRENDGEWEVQQTDKPILALSPKQGIRYDCYVVAGNDGGLSMPSPTLSTFLKASDSEADRSTVERKGMVNIIDAFSDTYGPDWFADSTYAGIVPGTYACEDRFSCAYIGEQWNFSRASLWINDDNCGWGSCYRDHAGQFTIGNTRDYAVLHGRVLQEMNISYVSCTAGSTDFPISSFDSFALIDYIAGRQRLPIDSAMQQLLSGYLEQGGRLLLSSDHLETLSNEWCKANLRCYPYASHATRSGRIAVSLQHPYRILLTPNEHQLFSATPTGLMPYGEEATRVAEYTDMRCPAAVGTSQSLVFGFPLEAVTDFESIYRYSIQRLLTGKEE
ncbi:MAG: N-acetylmuramoyl-L-alanine amidase [Paludibacteraceae bacterium]|nr:N-acetylmuramoyl-L-alanine amidase [Paludibacteraceae bacterium]